MTVKNFEPGRGYTQADGDEVSESPEVTAEMVAEMKPFAEMFPTLAAAIKRPYDRARCRNRAKLESRR